MRISDWSADVCSSDLHDTPDKALFSEKERQFSSGCVRLEDAPRLAKWLFGKKPKLESDVAEQQVPLPEPVPVYLSYLTVAPTDRGIAFLEDAYGRDGDQLERLAKRSFRCSLGVVGRNVDLKISPLQRRSDESRVGKECVRTCRARW